MKSPRILFFIAEDDLFPDGYHYLAWGLRRAWLDMGFEVEVARGLKEFRAAAPADLVFPHFDQTLTPPEIQEALRERHNVVNGTVHDISKSFVSRQLVHPDDDWGGGVIVKTDRNAGGKPEAHIAYRRRSLAQRALRKLRRMVRPGPAEAGPDWRTLDLIRDCRYPVFPSKAEVPEGVWENSNLVVERFLPEYDGEHYYLRWYFFFGDRYRCARIGSPEPIVKSRSKTMREDGYDVPPEILAYRAEIGMDYGKIDFVMHEGRPVVLDVNKTPGGPREDRMLLRAGPLAFGFRSLLEHGTGNVRALEHVNAEQTGFEPSHVRDWRAHIDVLEAPSTEGAS